jgi:hypothetical protein
VVPVISASLCPCAIAASGGAIKGATAAATRAGSACDASAAPLWSGVLVRAGVVPRCGSSCCGWPQPDEGLGARNARAAAAPGRVLQSGGFGGAVEVLVRARIERVTDVCDS